MSDELVEACQTINCPNQEKDVLSSPSTISVWTKQVRTFDLGIFKEEKDC